MNNNQDPAERPVRSSSGYESYSWPGAGSGAPAAGIVLILVGGFFLLRNAFGWHLNNWWALFILIPAVFLFANAVQLYRRSGRFTPAVLQAVTGGAFMALVASVFLLGLSWGAIWPLFLIIGGIAALSSGAAGR